ncbi:MAG: hypothetical protein VYE44_03235 [Verrucomicrobiota bacterium]|nr:hypothetical protein [Verrucomicrobiota bacterium]
MSAVTNHLSRVGVILDTALFLLTTSAPGQENQNNSPNFKTLEGKNNRLPRLKTALPKFIQIFGLFIQATSNDLLPWSVARDIQRYTDFLEQPTEAGSTQVQFFQLRFNN